VAAVAPLALGGVGVDLFFVLSGFLVGRIYFRCNRGGYFRLSKFRSKRWWRTVPAVLCRTRKDETGRDLIRALFGDNSIAKVWGEEIG
jgi:hypothetical protein